MSDIEGLGFYRFIKLFDLSLGSCRYNIQGLLNQFDAIIRDLA